MRVVVIVQARMSSTRLPGKVLLPLGGVPMVLRVAERAARILRVDDVVVATSTSDADDVLAKCVTAAGVSCFRGDQHDVLDRYYRCARERSATVVVRITADCPLLSPAVSSGILASFLSGGCDYASNCGTRTFPRGLDTEVMSFDALATAWREAVAQPDREHVTAYIDMNPARFRLRNVVDPAAADHSDMRWTVDEPADYDLVSRIYDFFKGRGDFEYADVLALLARQPDWLEINRDIHQKHYGE
jgi:spore coat polysaccharide biosynthesis protein SpsF